jgi:hypothetical protein
MPRYEVVCSLEVYASTPEKAARVARDMMLDPESVIRVDAHLYTYNEAADDWFPNYRYGWSASFYGDTHPAYCVKWKELTALPGAAPD